jgi:hypothetical protein
VIIVKSKCIKCGAIIPLERMELLHTKTCVNCSEEKPKLGITVWSKSTPELVIVDDIDRFKELENFDGCMTRL